MSRISKVITKMFGSARVHEHQPKVRPVGNSVEIDEDYVPPSGDGWIREPGRDPYRIIHVGARRPTTKAKPRTGSLTKRPRK